MAKVSKKDLLKKTVQHVDIKSFDSTKIINAMREMSFTSRDTARAADILTLMIDDKKSANILTLAGSTSAGGCMQVYVDMVKCNMIDAIVATGASIVDMDFFEAIGFKHYRGTPYINDKVLRSLHIDRIYDTFIDEESLQFCDRAIGEIADSLEPRPYSSREFIREMGRYLTKRSKKKNSLVQVAFEKDVPIFCPAFSELTQIKMRSATSGLFMIGGGVPKNFAQDTVVCAEVLGVEVPMHKYAVQITVADVRDGACSSSTLKEASSWGKVDTVFEQMVYAEATSVLPLIVSYAYHNSAWKKRKPRCFTNLYEP
jgi:deoxyhypusine synthase